MTLAVRCRSPGAEPTVAETVEASLVKENTVPTVPLLEAHRPVLGGEALKSEKRPDGGTLGAEQSMTGGGPVSPPTFPPPLPPAPAAPPLPAPPPLPTLPPAPPLA